MTILNHPATIICLGSALGWLSVSYIWLPYKTKNINKNKTNRYKKEVFLRLIELETSFENQYSTKIIKNLLVGNTPLNPDFKYWKLDTLIISGWTDSAYKNTYKTLSKLESLIEDSNITIDKTKTKQGLLLIDTLTMYLKNIQEK